MFWKLSLMSLKRQNASIALATGYERTDVVPLHQQMQGFAVAKYFNRWYGQYNSGFIFLTLALCAKPGHWLSGIVPRH